jgi:hypothetical protein
MPAISGTGQGANHLMLTELASKLVDGEKQISFDSAIHEQDVFLRVDMGNGTMVPFESAAFGDEAKSNRD